MRAPVAVEADYHESPKLAFVKMSEFVHYRPQLLFRVSPPPGLALNSQERQPVRRDGSRIPALVFESPRPESWVSLLGVTLVIRR
jgi:hypothetical protein